MLSVFWIKTSLDRHDHAHTLWGFNANWQLIVSELRAIFTVPDPPMALCHLTWADTHGGKPPSSGLSVAETEQRTGVLSSRGHDSRRAVGFLCVSGEGSPGARGAGVVRPDAPPWKWRTLPYRCDAFLCCCCRFCPRQRWRWWTSTRPNSPAARQDIISMITLCFRND